MQIYKTFLFLELVFAVLAIFYGARNIKTGGKVTSVKARETVVDALLCLIQLPQIYFEVTLKMGKGNVILSVVLFILWGIALIGNLKTFCKLKNSEKYWKGYMFDKDDENVEIK